MRLGRAGVSDLQNVFDSELGLDVIVVRLIAATLFGGIIGFEREYLARPAGMRTHILVALAAATFAVVTLELMAHANAQGVTSTDPIRVIEAVTAGVAFLAAGTIIFSRGEVHGLTTGASLWLAGAIGVACGIGYYFIAILATVLAFLVLTVLRWVEKAMPQKGKPLVADGGEKPAAE
jgi:putative Mg2+ transporter-C (MgtC) family protein